MVDALPRDSIGGDEGGRCLWGPTSEVPAEQEANRTEERVSLSGNERLLSSTNWKGSSMSVQSSEMQTGRRMRSHENLHRFMLLKYCFSVFVYA